MNAVCLHLVWATWGRLPTLMPEIREIVYRQIITVGRELRCEVKAIGGIENHVHVVVAFSTTTSIAELVKAMKGTSAHLINHQTTGQEGTFKWQGAYGVFPVEPDSLLRVIRYVENQEQNHSKGSLDPTLEQTQKEVVR